MKTLPNYHPPADYRRPTKTQEKVYVPVNDYPEINFSMELTPLTFFVLLFFALPSLCLDQRTQTGHCLQYSFVTNPYRCNNIDFDHILTTAFCTNSWPTYWSSWKHAQEDGV